MYDLVVTKNKALVTYLLRCNLVTSDVPVKYPVETGNVAGKHVIGELPCRIACMAASYTEIPLHLPPQIEGLEPILADYVRYAYAPVTYLVTKTYTHPRAWAVKS